MKKMLTLIILVLSFIFFLGTCSSDTEKTKKIEYTFLPTNKTSVKLQGKVPLDFVNGEMPTIDYLKEIATQIIDDNPQYENYFIYFTFPFVEYIEKESSDTSLYYLISKIGNSDFNIQPLYSNLEFNKLTFRENLIGHLGINKISNISPIIIGTPIKDTIAKLGTPSKMDEGEYKDNCIYYITNENRQMLGLLYLDVKDGKISDVSFYSANIQFTESQLKQIKLYILGSKKLEDLNIKELQNIF